MGLLSTINILVVCVICFLVASEGVGWGKGDLHLMELESTV